MAAQYDDQDAGEIVQELLAKIFSDGALSWAVRHHYQSRSTHYSFRAHDHNAILAQLTPTNNSFAPFIEKLKQYLNRYQDTDSRHF